MSGHKVQTDVCSGVNVLRCEIDTLGPKEGAALRAEEVLRVPRPIQRRHHFLNTQDNIHCRLTVTHNRRTLTRTRRGLTSRMGPLQ